MVSSGAIPDLRYSSKKVHKRYADVVLGGALLKMVMPDFAGDLTPAEVRQIQAYVLSRARATATEGAH